MTKIHTTLSIDEEVLKSAKDKGLNMSQVTEQALREKTGKCMTAEDDDKECQKCGAKGDLMWLCPYEYWICEKCLRIEVKKIIVGIVPS